MYRKLILGLKQRNCIQKTPPYIAFCSFHKHFYCSYYANFLGRLLLQKLNAYSNSHSEVFWKTFVFTKISPENVRGRVPLHENIFFYVRSGSIANVFLKNVSNVFKAIIFQNTCMNGWLLLCAEYMNITWFWLFFRTLVWTAGCFFVQNTWISLDFAPSFFQNSYHLLRFQILLDYGILTKTWFFN